MSAYKIGDIIKGKVTGIEKYGIFVSFEGRETGLIHISEISTSFVRNVSDYVDIGEEIYVKVLDIDEESHKLKLSIKDLNYRDESKLHTVIEENGSGFLLLKSSLKNWIASTEEEIEKNKKKP